MGSIPAMDEDRERLLQIDGAMPRLNAIPGAAPSTRAARRSWTAAAASGPTCCPPAPRRRPAGCTTVDERGGQARSMTALVEVKDLAKSSTSRRPG
jgi:hypothetical protein